MRAVICAASALLIYIYQQKSSALCSHFAQRLIRQQRLSSGGLRGKCGKAVCAAEYIEAKAVCVFRDAAGFKAIERSKIWREESKD